MRSSLLGLLVLGCTADPKPVQKPLPAAEIHFEAVAQVGDEFRLLKDTETLPSGTAIRLRVQARAVGHLVVVMKDHKGALTTVHSATGGRSVLVKARKSPQLLGAQGVQVVGAHTLIAVFCARPFLVRTLKAQVGPGPVAEPLMPGCRQKVWQLTGQ